MNKIELPDTQIEFLIKLLENKVEKSERAIRDDWLCWFYNEIWINLGMTWNLIEDD